MYVRSVKQYSKFKKIPLNLQKQIPLGKKNLVLFKYSNMDNISNYVLICSFTHSIFFQTRY